jgi:beta-glucanase (GH16 family)
VAAPQVGATAAQNGAQLVSLSSTTSGAIIHFTLDGSAPTASSQIYQAPMLVDSNLTVKAIAISAGTQSSVTSQSFTMSIPSGTLVWSDEFANATGSNAQPSSSVWTYDTGNSGFGNSELENYCAWGSSAAPCSTATPNAYVGTDGVLHIVAEEPSTGVYTSARMRTQGLFSFQYGRLEARMKLPEAQGMWPAFWLLGNNIATINWPACGELDVMEHIDGNDPPPYFGAPPAGYDWIAGSVHGGTSGAEVNGSAQYHPSGFSAADWHTYGMIWSKGEIEYYVDDPSNVYATYTPTNGTFNGKWPFDDAPEFIILNLAVGGSWPGAPDSATTFPAEMQVDYVRLYAN